jgi:hypothetical protein
MPDWTGSLPLKSPVGLSGWPLGGPLGALGAARARSTEPGVPEGVGGRPEGLAPIGTGGVPDGLPEGISGAPEGRGKAPNGIPEIIEGSCPPTALVGRSGIPLPF